eukprot:1157957-Pelagomonas_calceolata.AAC.15
MTHECRFCIDPIEDHADHGPCISMCINIPMWNMQAILTAAQMRWSQSGHRALTFPSVPGLAMGKTKITDVWWAFGIF